MVVLTNRLDKRAVVMTCVFWNLTIGIFIFIKHTQNLGNILWYPIGGCIVVAPFVNSGIQTLMGNINLKSREYSDVHT